MKPRLGRNAFANLAGALLPSVVYLWSVPLTLHYLGDQGYGIFALLTSVVGYFAVMDLNVTSGALKYVAQHHAREELTQVDEVISLGLAFCAVVGLAGMSLLLLLAPWFVEDAVGVPPGLRADTTLALRFAGVGFLFSQIQGFLQGVPQALQRYDVSSGVESAFGVAVPLITVALLATGHGLATVMLARALLTLLNAGVLWVTVRRLLPSFSLRRASRLVAGRMAGFVGYSYLARLASVSYQEGDKLLLGVLSGPAAVALYAVPLALVQRMFSLTYRLGAVTMPAASALGALGRSAEIRQMALVAARYTLFLNASAVLVLIVFSLPLLSLWLGAERAGSIGPLLTLLLLGAVCNSMTNVPSLVNDGLGHPRLTGRFAIAHAVLGLAVGAVAISRWGAMGAAASQCLMSLLMMGVFNAYIAGRTVPWSIHDYAVVVLGPSLPLLLASAAFVAHGGVSVSRGAMFAGVPLLMLVLGGYGYALVLRAHDRERILLRLRAQWRRLVGPRAGGRV